MFRERHWPLTKSYFFSPKSKINLPDHIFAWTPFTIWKIFGQNTNHWNIFLTFKKIKKLQLVFPSQRCWLFTYSKLWVNTQLLFSQKKVLLVTFSKWLANTITIDRATLPPQLHSIVSRTYTHSFFSPHNIYKGMQINIYP